MNRRLPMMIDPTWVGGIAGMLGALLVASLSLGQVPLPDVAGAASDTVQSSTQTAQDATKSATDTASDATKSATDTASDATKSATDTARDATKSATDTARDATKSARDTAKSATKTGRDAAKSATDTTRDATKSATDTARDATRRTTDTARDAARDATDVTRDATRSATDSARDAAKSTRDTTRSATDAARDATRSATDTARDAAKSGTDTARDATRRTTDTARDAARDATDATRDVTRSATDTARDATRSATEATRDATDSARDAARATTSEVRDAAQDVGREARDAAQDVRDTARDASRSTRDAARDATDDVRDQARDINTEVRDSVNDVRRSARDTSQSIINENVTSDSSVRSSSSINTSSLRGADLGVWFDRSVRNGLVIADVAADAALAQVGFVEGDRIVSVNGRTITTEQDFTRMILAENVRQPVNVVVMRGGQQETLVIDPVVIRERFTTVRTDPLERFGIILDDRITDRLIVWRVIPRSPAFYAGIRPGDEITMFAGQRIADPAKFVQVVERTDPGLIPVQISRAGRVRQIEVDYPQFQVSEQRTSFRQDLDADTRIETQNAAPRANSNLRGQLNSDVNVDIERPGATVQETTEAQVEVQPAQPRSSQPTYRPAAPRRGLFRRR